MRLLLLALSALFLITSISAQVPGYVPTAGLAGWWPFSGNANDESGTDNDGTLYGPTLTTDRFGNVDQAFAFDGASYIRVADNGAFLDLTDDFTISCWALAGALTQASHGMITKHIGNQNDDGTFIYVIGDALNVGAYYLIAQATPNYNNSTLPSTATDPALNQWYHYLVTYEDAVDRLIYYVDGTAIDTVTVPFEILNTSIDMLFGSTYIDNTSTLNYYWSGKLDDIGIWQRALSAPEVNGLYIGSGVGVPETPVETSNLHAFPNPSNGSFVLEHTLSGKVELRVFDLTGRQVYAALLQASNDRARAALDLVALNTGTYLLQVWSNGEVLSQRLVIE